MQKLRTLLLLFLVTTICAYAQIGHGGLPYSFENQWHTDIETITMPAVDAAEMALIDEQYYLVKGRSIRFGEEHKVDFGLTNSGEWKTLPNNDKVWRLKIVCPEAFHINLIYDSFFMPEGAKFYIYNTDGSQVLGAFTSGNNKSYGTFSTGLIRGQETILEYYEPAAVSGQGLLNVSTVVHAYRSIIGNLEKGYGDSGSCNININCPQGADWQTIKTSVVKILDGGYDHCTGTMINTVRQDCTPYFLTADHCSGGEQNWVFYYNWESSGCENEFVPLSQSVSGGQKVASLSAVDFELLELSAEPPLDYNVFYAGWNVENTAAPRSTCIHHPEGDIKKISFNYDALVSSTFAGTPNSHWEVTEWEEGTTEPGSSGSALFDENQRIVGMLSGGAASCSFTSGYDVYGKMSYSWNQGNNASNRLRDWLDPDATGTTILDGRSCAVNTDFNAAIYIQEPIGEYCELVIIPKVRLSNQGLDPLTVVAVEYFVDNNPPTTSIWTGNLLSGTSTIFELGAVAGVEGAHTFTACLQNINGATSDDNDTDNCSTFSFSCPDLALGIEQDVLGFEAYPNPAVDDLTVELGVLPSDDTFVSLRDISGRELMSIKPNGDKVVLSLPQSLANGTYLLTVSNGNVDRTEKINILR